MLMLKSLTVILQQCIHTHVNNGCSYSFPHKLWNLSTGTCVNITTVLDVYDGRIGKLQLGSIAILTACIKQSQCPSV